MKLCLDENIPELKKCFNSDFEITEFNTNDNLREILLNTGAEYLFCRSTIKANAELLDGARVKFIATATSGTDHFDKEYLEANNIAYFDALGSNSNSVAEYVIFGILLYSLRNNFPIDGRTLGVVGFGNVGSKLAKYAHKLGLKVYVNDPPLLDADFQFPEYAEYRELDYICANCDIISNHVPREISGKYPTINLFNSKNLALVKKSALFIHASRGTVVDEIDLQYFADEKNLTLIMDVWESEPLANIDLAMKAIIATPHIAGHSYEGKIRGSLMVAEAFEKFTGIILDKTAIENILAEYKPADDAFYGNLISMFETLKSKRLTLNDSLEFKDSMALSKEMRAQFFKNYRRTYPIRRETL